MQIQLRRRAIRDLLKTSQIYMRKHVYCASNRSDAKEYPNLNSQPAHSSTQIGDSTAATAVRLTCAQTTIGTTASAALLCCDFHLAIIPSGVEAANGFPRSPLGGRGPSFQPPPWNGQHLHWGLCFDKRARQPYMTAWSLKFSEIPKATRRF